MILFSCFAGILLLISKTNTALLNENIININEVEEEEDRYSSLNDAIVEKYLNQEPLSHLLQELPQTNIWNLTATAHQSQNGTVYVTLFYNVCFWTLILSFQIFNLPWFDVFKLHNYICFNNKQAKAFHYLFFFFFWLYYIFSHGKSFFY